MICVAAVPLSAQASRGGPLFDAGDWAGAKAEFSASIHRNDRDARAHYYLGRLAMLDDDADAAAAQFERAWARDQAQPFEPYIKKHPDDPYGNGRIAALSGQQLDRGQKGIRAFIAKPPKDAGALVLSGAYRRLGLILEFEEEHAEARSAIEHALILDPRNEEAMK